MSDGVWVERADVYLPSKQEWAERFIGYYKTPKGNVRPCGHRHEEEGTAERCATATYTRVMKETSR